MIYVHIEKKRDKIFLHSIYDRFSKIFLKKKERSQHIFYFRLSSVWVNHSLVKISLISSDVEAYLSIELRVIISDIYVK